VIQALPGYGVKEGSRKGLFSTNTIEEFIGITSITDSHIHNDHRHGSCCFSSGNPREQMAVSLMCLQDARGSVVQGKIVNLLITRMARRSAILSPTSRIIRRLPPSGQHRFEASATNSRALLRGVSSDEGLNLSHSKPSASSGWSITVGFQPFRPEDRPGQSWFGLAYWRRSSFEGVRQCCCYLQ